MRRFLLYQLICLFALTANATDRTPAQMLSIAKQRLAPTDGVSKTRSASNGIGCLLEKPTLSVYGNDNGFVVISRDDRFQPVLAYGPGKFSLTDMPDAARWWMDAIQESMANYVFSSASAPSKMAAVAPMLTTKWGQDSPYNNYAPLFKKDKTKAPAGCVALAMAQIMNYHQYPASAEFRSFYTISDGADTTYVNVDSEYKWPYKNAYGNYYPEGSTQMAKASYTPNQGNQVATLCRDCGYAVCMHYNPSGSGAYASSIPSALIDKFNYPVNAVRYYYRDFYSEQEWMDVIYGELQKGYPFIYSGSYPNNDGGHAFVADGIDGDGLLHINWGWYGFYDGYYDFRLLNPGENEFSKGQEIVTGIRPEAIEGDCYGSMVGTEKPFELSYDNATKTLTVKEYGIYNYCAKPIKGSVAIFFENLTDIQKCDTLEFLDEGETLLPFYGWVEDEGEFETEFNPGEYKVYLASMDEHETEYQMGRADGIGEFYYEMTVDADGTVTIGAEPVCTGIEQIAVDTTNKRQKQYADRTYDLNGRQVGSPDSRQQKGIYILNGRKVVR